jgi:AraC-like DNA-binding protein
MPLPRFVSVGWIAKAIPSYPVHQHEAWELVLYTHGRGVATVGDRAIPFRPGRLICMPPHVPHKEVSESGYRNFYILAYDFPAIEPVPVVEDTPDRQLFQLARMLRNEAHLKRPGWQIATEDLFDLLIFLIRRAQAPKKEHSLVERLKGVMVEHLHDSEFRVGDAMRDLPMAPDHLRRLFRQATGATPLDYLTELRVSEAKRLLKVGGLAVKQVAERIGIPDPYYFSRVFHRMTGRRPSGYLKS